MARLVREVVAAGVVGTAVRAVGVLGAVRLRFSFEDGSEEREGGDDVLSNIQVNTKKKSVSVPM